MLAGDITIRMAADIADLRSGFDQARGTVTNFTEGAVSGFERLKTTIETLFAGGVFTEFVNSTTEAEAHLLHLSQSMGVSVESLSSLTTAAKVAGVGIDSVVFMSDKLSKNLLDSGSAGQKARDVLDQLGFSAGDLANMLADPSQAMYMIGQRLNEFPDSGSKAAAAMVLFGRSGAEALPFLRELGEQSQLTASMTQAQVLAAEEFRRALVNMEDATAKAARTNVDALLPSLTAIANGVRDYTTASGNAVGIMQLLGDALGIMALGVATIVTFIKDLIVVLQGLYQSFMAIIDLKMKDVFDGIWRDRSADIGKNTDALFAFHNEVVKGNGLLGANLQALQLVNRALGGEFTDSVDRANSHHEQLNITIGKTKDVIDPALKAAADYINKLQEEATTIGMTTEQLEAYKAKQLGVYEAVKPSIEQKSLMTSLLAVEKEALKNATDAWNAYVGGMNQAGDTQVKVLAGLESLVTSANNDTAVMGLQGAAREKAIALLKLEADAVFLTADQYALMRDRISQAYDRKALSEEAIKAAQEVAKAWQEVTDKVGKAMGDFLNEWIDKGATTAFKDLWDKFKKWALEALAEIAAKQIVVSITGALGVTGANASGGGGGIGLGDLLNLGSKGASLFGNSAGTTLAGLFGPEFVTGAESIAAGFTAAGAGAEAAVGFGTEMVAAGSIATEVAMGLAAAVPVVGAVVAAAYLAYTFLNQAKGGPKDGGFATTGDTPGITNVDPNGRWMTPNTQDAGMQAAVNAINTQYETILKALGGTGSATFAQGFSTDPKGTAPSNVHTGTWVNGVQVMDNANGSVGRTTEELQAELEKQSMRAILAALQASALPTVIKDYLASIDVSTATVDQIKAALAKAAELKVLIDLVAALPKGMSDGLLAALGQSPELDAKIKAFALTFGEFSVAAGKLADQLTRNPMAEATAQITAASETTFGAVTRLRTSLQDQLATYDGTAAGTDKLTAATKAYVDAQVAALVQIDQIKKSLDTMFGDTQRTFDLALLDSKAKEQFFAAEAAKTVELLKNTTDPAKIAELSKIVNSDLTSALGLIDPIAQKAEYDHLQGILTDAQGAATTQLALAKDSVLQANTNAQTVLTSVQTAVNGASDKFAAAAQAIIDAAAVLKQAAIDNAATAATNATTATTNVTAANTNLTAANTPIKVDVTVYNDGSGP